MSKIPDVQTCPSCGCYQRRGMLCIKCATAAASAPDGFEIAFGASVSQSIKEQGPGIVMSTPSGPNSAKALEEHRFVFAAARHGMNIGADYFGIDGPSCAEVAASIRRAHDNPIGHPVFGSPLADNFTASIGPTESVIALDLKTATTTQLQQAAEAIRLEHVARHQARLKDRKPKAISERREFTDGMLVEVTHHHIEQEVVMALLEDTDSMLNQGLADALDAQEIEWAPIAGPDVGVVHYGPKAESVPIGRHTHGDPAPVPLTEEARSLKGMGRYLSPDWDIPTCPVIGKAPHEHCKHGMGNLDYCPHCEHDNDDMDLSEVEI